ncbi:protocatechuate 3,4-dioxygenase subunit alpha [Streptomyces spiroverticillatus]|uniref:Protocatechuate 3,4-dioxygenase subunit alpha n=1 Tax=Streptomyces finlayi TaxID=67296 RepID=A0A919CAK4_9ACTN|nr:protocatechuate 3,4-dioxygenase subunit alpha [Streptomyces finlayi]GHA15418.1 protocatechuate 3,4-dioxygenase subunit alpha [Streptomyces spiroverticillatus]GHC96742.1 protocatechuate 3,4-dioxygenase subunit alpha [Streptomyces finlayi]
MPGVLPPTPSQTVGPFYGYALPFTGGGDIAPAGHPDTVTVHGYVRDGNGDPIPDAVIETWQAAPDGSLAGLPGSLRRDPVTGGFLGRNGVDFTGFGRVATDADGYWAVRTLTPPDATPYLSVCVFARGLMHHLYTRAYFTDDIPAGPLAELPAARRATLLAVPESDGLRRFDIRVQGERETVFLDFR